MNKPWETCLSRLCCRLLRHRGKRDAASGDAADVDQRTRRSRAISRRAADDYHAAHAARDAPDPRRDPETSRSPPKCRLALQSDTARPTFYFTQGAQHAGRQSQSGKVADITLTRVDPAIGRRGRQLAVDGKRMGIPTR